jgi:CHAT domain-containing protein/tetratricopeptide (TPR) repeat protein
MTIAGVVRRLSRNVVLLWALHAATALIAAEPSAELKDLQQAAAALYTAGDYAAALNLAERALPLVVEHFGAEHEQTGIHYHSLGLLGEASGNLEAAERYFTRSLQIREKLYGADDAATAVALQKLGTLYVKMGRLDAAEPPLRRALKIRQGLTGAGTPFTASGIADLASLSLARGDWPAALASYREAIRLIAGQEASQSIQRAIADEEIGRSREAFVGLSRAAWQLRATNGAALREEAYTAAQLAWTTSAASALAKMTARIGAGDTDLGRRIRGLQDLTERVLQLHGEDQRLLTRWSDVERADPLYSALLEEFRATSIALGRDRAPAIKRQRELIAQLEALQRCGPGRPQAGCEAASSERAAIAKELSELSAATTVGSDKLTGLHARLEAAEKALPGYREFAAARAALRTGIDQGERGVRQARAEIVRAFPRYLALAEPKPLSISETQVLLQDDEALIAILTGAFTSFVWAITRERVGWAEIAAGNAALGEQVQLLRRGLDPLAQQDAEGAAGVRAGIVAGFDTHAAHALYLKVLGPVQDVFAAKRHLIVVPTGALTSLPFQVLLTEPAPAAGATPSAEVLRGAGWLIRRHALSVLPSVPSLSALRTLPGTLPGTATKPFFGMGDPLLEGPDPRDRQRGVKPVASAGFYRNGLADVRAVRELARLPETADELMSIARVLGAPPEAVNLREAATETKVKSTALSEYRIVQFATHGLVAGDLSGLAEPALVLTPPEQPSAADDGLLTASEIATLKLNADWVVLSACNTAAGSREGAEALSGLARAFFYAGARALLVSHWAVYSAAATELTTRTFASLAAAPGIGRAAALQQAMRALIAEGKPPGYWAPFIVVGEAGRGQR